MSPDSSSEAYLWIDVRLIYIVGPDRGHGNEFSRRCRCDSHEDQQESRARSTLTQQSHGGIGQYKSGSDICIWNAMWVGWEDRIVFKSKRGEAHGSGTKPRDCEPREAAHDIAW